MQNKLLNDENKYIQYSIQLFKTTCSVLRRCSEVFYYIFPINQKAKTSMLKCKMMYYSRPAHQSPHVSTNLSQLFVKNIQKTWIILYLVRECPVVSLPLYNTSGQFSNCLTKCYCVLFNWHLHLCDAKPILHNLVCFHVTDQKTETDYEHESY